MNETAEKMKAEVKEVARLRDISPDLAITEIVKLYAPVYIEKLKKGE